MNLSLHAFHEVDHTTYGRQMAPVRMAAQGVQHASMQHGHMANLEAKINNC